MKRRAFITLLGGTAATWPLAARAQQPERMRRIGVLMSTAITNPEAQARLAAFQQGLQQLGWIVCRNVQLSALPGRVDPVGIAPIVCAEPLCCGYPDGRNRFALSDAVPPLSSPMQRPDSIRRNGFTPFCRTACLSEWAAARPG